MAQILAVMWLKYSLTFTKSEKGISMKPQNLISVYQGAAALEKLGKDADKKFKV